MEDVTIKYDGTVRNSCGEVLQFLYGEDGMDAVSLEFQKLPHIGITDAKLREEYEHNFADPNYGRERERPSVGARGKRERGARDVAQREDRVVEAKLRPDHRQPTRRREGPAARAQLFL